MGFLKIRIHTVPRIYPELHCQNQVVAELQQLMILSIYGNPNIIGASIRRNFCVPRLKQAPLVSVLSDILLRIAQLERVLRIQK
jgi:hypothetical protein